jgi:hypothetical protein
VGLPVGTSTPLNLTRNNQSTAFNTTGASDTRTAKTQYHHPNNKGALLTSNSVFEGGRGVGEEKGSQVRTLHHQNNDRVKAESEMILRF